MLPSWWFSSDKKRKESREKAPPEPPKIANLLFLRKNAQKKMISQILVGGLWVYLPFFAFSFPVSLKFWKFTFCSKRSVPNFGPEKVKCNIVGQKVPSLVFSYVL